MAKATKSSFSPVPGLGKDLRSAFGIGCSFESRASITGTVSTPSSGTLYFCLSLGSGGFHGGILVTVLKAKINLSGLAR